MAAVDDVASAVVGLTGSITAMKLQKLVYYVQVWHLVDYGSRAFPDDVQAWSQGPVVRRLYDQHKGVFRVTSWRSGDRAALSKTVVETVRKVVAVYGALSAGDLSEIAHRELPWREARRGAAPAARSETAIEPETIVSFYERQRGGAPAEMVEHVVASGRLEGAEEPTVERRRLLESVAAGETDGDTAVAAVLAGFR